MQIKHQALISLGQDRSFIVYLIPKGDTPEIRIKEKVDIVICPKITYERFKTMVEDTLNEHGTVITY